MARTTTSTSRPTAPIDPYAELISLARSTGSRHLFFKHALQCIGQAFGAPYATINLRQGAEVISHEFHSGPTAPRFWRDDVRRFVSEGLLDAATGPRSRRMGARRGRLQVVFMCTPLVDAHGQPGGALAVVCASEQDIDVQQRMTLLDSLGRVVTALGANLGHTGPQDRGGAAARAALAQSAGLDDPTALAYSITNNLRNKLGCEQVAFGVVRRRHIDILSISGFDDVNTRSAAVAGLRAAMEECLDARTTIVCTSDQAWSGRGQNVHYALHRAWHQATGGDGVASLPLERDGVVRAVISVRFPSRQRYDAPRLEDIRQRVEAYLPALDLARRASRGVVAHVGDDVRRAVTVLCRGPRRRWVTALAVLAGLITMGVGTAPYHVVAPAVVKPARVHHVTAPFDGRLVDSHVVAGDRVEAGAVLCRLDDAVLQLDRADLVAQIDVLERRIDRARSESHPGDAAVLASERRVLEARLRGVDQRIGDCVVRAPHDGIVIEGDLRERIGAVVERGAPFFRIATDRAWLLEVRIPERDVEELSTGLGGTFALNARPTTRHDLEVTTVSPFLTVAQRRNVCMAEARVALDDGWVRPGMEGVARIDVGRRRLWWIAAHRLLDRACLAIWF